MRRIFIAVCLVLLVCPVSALAAAPKLKLVETSVSGRITNRWGEPMVWPNGADIVFFKFIKNTWSPQLWAHIRFRPDAQGNFMSTGIFPIDSAFTRSLVKYAAGRDKLDIDVGVQVLSQSGQVVRCPDGIRIELSRYGAFPWTPGKVATINGQPDDTGRMWPKMSIPIDATTLQNFTLLANGQGK